jgi:hypothetical protein
VRAAAGLLLLILAGACGKGAAPVADFSGTSVILDALSNAGLVRDLLVVYLTGADNTRYAYAIDELAALVDQRYRTLAPADGPAF